MTNSKLKIYLKNGTYFWVEMNKGVVKATFNGDAYYLTEKDGYILKFKNESDDKLEFEMSKNNNEEVINHISEYWENGRI